jgi:hypothetical protein
MPKEEVIAVPLHSYFRMLGLRVEDIKEPVVDDVRGRERIRTASVDAGDSITVAAQGDEAAANNIG